MAAFYSKVVIIYNPNSTGDSPQLGQELFENLKARLPKTNIVLQKTDHPGHAEALAYQAATSGRNVLIISVSGDGGYNEVVNGAMKAISQDKATPICAVAPGGNANDHYTELSDKPLVQAILDGQLRNLDILEATYGDKTRFAHSYVGLGLTPLVAQELNRHALSSLKEAWLALKTYWGLQPFTIINNGAKKSFNSLLIANISTMAKYLTLSKDSKPNDGKFEVILWPHQNKFRLAYTILKSALGIHIPGKKLSTYSFMTTKPMPMQLDGEIVELPKNCTVNIRISKQKLRTIL